MPRNLGIGLGHLAVLLGLSTAGLAESIPGGNALHDNGKPVGGKGVAPGKVGRGIPAGDFRVPSNQLVAGGQARGGAWLEALVSAANRHCSFVGGGDIGSEDVGQVRQRMANSAHFPVQDANDAGLRLVENDIVDFVVAVHKRGAVLRLRLGVGEKRYHGVLVRDLADGLPRLLVLGCRLRLRYRVEGGDLAAVEARVLAVGC